MRNIETNDFKPHPILENIPYRLWNIVSNGLIQRSPTDPEVTCMGGFNGNNSKFDSYFKYYLTILLCKNYF